MNPAGALACIRSPGSAAEVSAGKAGVNPKQHYLSVLVWW